MSVERPPRMGNRLVLADAKAALEKRKNDIKSPDDLASVMKLVLAETGPVAAKANWIAFSVAGAQHMLVECTQETYIVLRRLAERCDERGWRPDEVLAELTTGWMASSDEVDAAEHEQASGLRQKGSER